MRWWFDHTPPHYQPPALREASSESTCHEFFDNEAPSCAGT